MDRGVERKTVMMSPLWQARCCDERSGRHCHEYCTVDDAGREVCATDRWTVLHFIASMNTLDTLALWESQRRGQSLAQDRLDARDAHGRTALHMCCWKDHFEVLRWLLRLGANHWIRDDTAGRSTALHTALANDAWWCVSELLQRICTAPPQTQEEGIEPLSTNQWVEGVLAYRWSPPLDGGDREHWGAAALGRPWSVEKPLFETEARRPSLTLLHIACMEPSLHPLALLLCRECPQLCAVATANGCVPMHLAAVHGSGNSALLKALLHGDADGKACVSAWSDHSGMLPVHVLARFGVDDVVLGWMTKTLHALRLDVDPSALVDRNGWTVLHHCCDAMARNGDPKHFEVVQMLTRTWGLSMSMPSRSAVHCVTSREIVEQSPYADALLALIDTLDEFYESHDF